MKEDSLIAKNFQQRDALWVAAYMLVFAVSLVPFFISSLNGPDSTLLGFPALTLWLTCCFFTFLLLTFIGYHFVFRSWTDRVGV